MDRVLHQTCRNLLPLWHLSGCRGAQEVLDSARVMQLLRVVWLGCDHGGHICICGVREVVEVCVCHMPKKMLRGLGWRYMKILELVMFYGSMLFPPHHKAADRIFTEPSRQTFNTFWHYIHSGKTNMVTPCPGPCDQETHAIANLPVIPCLTTHRSFFPKARN